ncbi:MAG: ABC transporter permease [Silvibacterium sp.]
MHRMLQNIRYAVRQLRKSPGFVLTVVITLALGIGANTALFSVMNAVLLRSLPVRNPDQLFYLMHEHMPDGTSSTGNSSLSYGINIYNHLKADHSVFSDVIAYVPLSQTKTVARSGDVPEEIQADEVSGNFFSALGANMVAGQAFVPADETKHSQVAVISYGYWTRRFNRDSSVIGKPVYVNGVPLIIIGVAAPHFYGVESGGEATDLWTPLQNRPELNAWGVPVANNTLYGSPNWWSLMLMARLKAGVTPQQAVARMDPVFVQSSYETVGQAKTNSDKLELQMVPARGLGTASADYENPLRVLMGMVALVLLIACVNIVMLLAARNSIREREFALRLALGAGRGPLFLQLLAESAILVAAGALLGWFFAVQATRLLAVWSALEVSLAPDKTVLFFTLAISALAALLFGLAPLRAAANAPVGLVLRSGGSQTTASRSRVLSGKVLISLQMAFCVVLLFGAGLLLRTLQNYQDVDLGLKADRVLAFGVHPLGTLSHDQMIAFYDQLTERLRRLPGVESVTLAEIRPGTGWSDNSALIVDGRTIPWDSGKGTLRTNEVGPDYFKTLGIPILAGRDITAADKKGAPMNVIVVNQTLAERYLKGTNPLGHLIGNPKYHVTIIGVVRDSKYTSTGEEPMPMAWYSYQQDPSPQRMDVELRVSGNPMVLLPEIRRAVREMAPNIPLNKPEVLSEGFKETYLMPALFARLAIFFAGLAALLVAIGLYGTLAYRVNRRTAEIGVRIVLGAARGQVLWMVLRDSLVLVAAGLGIGLPLAWFASKLMASMLYQLSAHDPLSFIVAGLGVLLVSVAAAYIPARRAASVEPMQALRAE